jgi:hypothetical protein
MPGAPRACTGEQGKAEAHLELIDQRFGLPHQLSSSARPIILEKANTPGS